MATVHLHQTTIATPEQFLAGLTGCGPGLPKAVEARSYQPRQAQS